MEKPNSFYGYFLEQIGEAFTKTEDFKIQKLDFGGGIGNGKYSNLSIIGPNSAKFDFFFTIDSHRTINIHGSAQTKFYVALDLDDPNTNIETIVDLVKSAVLVSLSKRTINQYFNQVEKVELFRTASTLEFKKKGSTQRTLNRLMKKWGDEWRNKPSTSSK